MKLYGRPQSGYTKKVRIGLAEKGRLEQVPLVVVSREESRKAAHRARHPLGLVPVLEHDGRYLAESTAILVYLDAVHPEPPLLPVDAWQRAEAFGWDRYADQALTPPVRTMMFRDERGDDAPMIQAAQAEIRAVFDHLDHSLADKDFLVGDAFSLADLAFVARLQLFPKIQFPLPDELEHVVAWRDRLAERPSWTATG